LRKYLHTFTIIVMIRSLYIHVPFCQSRCTYCNFYSGEPLEGLADYPALIAAEAILRSRQLRPGPLKTLYLGGGTPSLLGVEGIGEILRAIKDITPLESGCEVTVEVNPASALDFRALAALGVTRVSVGVQALDDANLATLGRTHSAKDALETVREAVAAGMDVSGDLIYGYEGLDCETLTEAAKTLVKCGVGHLSAYSLEDSTPDGVPHTTSEVEAAHREALVTTLADLGIERYEVSNFARPGCESRHNVNYWEGGGYLGLGPGAHGYLPEVGNFGERYENQPDLAAYRSALERGELPSMSRELLTREDALMERLLLQLRRASAFSSTDLLPDSSTELTAFRKLLKELCKSGDLVALGSDYVPTPSGLERADGLALWLFERLKG
jgi:oxygen-independent coproporphyrinogen-3 oxidase